MAKFKKLAMLGTAALMTVSMALMATSCAGGHVCTYGEDWSKDDTYHWYGCTSETCTADKPVGKEEHNWDNGVVTPATEEVEGETLYTCVVCGQTKSEAIAKIVYDQPVSGEGTTDTPYVISGGSYKQVVTKEMVDSWQYTFYSYTATADGAVTISYQDENASVSASLNGESLSNKIGNTVVPVRTGDVITVMVSTSWSYEWPEGQEAYNVYFALAYDDEVPAANGTSYNPYVVTAEDFQADWDPEYIQELTVEFDAEVNEVIYYQYTVTGDDTIGLWISSSSAITAVSDTNWTLNLTGGDSIDGVNKAYMKAVKGDVITLTVQSAEYAVKKAELSFAIQETNETYEDGSEANPWVISAEGESYTDLEFPQGMWGPGSICFTYTATENGTLSVSGVAVMNYNWNDVTSIEVVAGETYMLKINYNWETEETSVSPVFTFTAA